MTSLYVVIEVHAESFGHDSQRMKLKLSRVLSTPQQLPDRSYFPNIFHRSLRNRQNSLPYAVSLYPPSGTISQIAHARPCGLQQ